MKFISIDVGIKNLSFCLFNTNTTINTIYEIISWDNIDLTEKYERKCSEADATNKSTGICGKPAKFTKHSKCYCLKHAKKTNYLLPATSPDLQTAFLNKQKIPSLMEISNKYKIPCETSWKRADLLNAIREFGLENCFEPISKTNATKVDLVTIGKNIQHKFDLLFQDHIETIETIIIENQIGPLANKMKTLQGMLAQYFIMKNNHIKIEFISSSNKLKEFIKQNQEEKQENQEKMDYKQRKQLGIKTCISIVSSDLSNTKWSEFVQTHKKKDDLSDCFLQGLWYIKNKL